MLESLKALLASRKTIAVLLAITASVVLCLCGKIPVADVATYTTTLTAILVAAIAGEDMAMKRNESNGMSASEVKGPLQ